MATIGKRTRKGKTVWVARIRKTRKGEGTFSEARSFETEEDARTWAAEMERRLREEPTISGAVRSSERRNPTVREIIDRYLAMKRDLSVSKKTVLRRIRSFGIGDIRIADLTPGDVMDFAAAKAEDEVLPSTVTRYLAELSAVVDFAKVYWRVEVDTAAMGDAWTMARKLGIAGKSRRRDRRPTLKELDRILRFLHERRLLRPSTVPMDRIVVFALLSTRRRSEICRLQWSDLDVKAQQIIVRDMKHPGEKVGNNVLVDLPPPSMAIARSMPRRKKRIFPYEPETLSTLFAEACREAYVHDLRFHDLRHEGVSRLFELGWNVPRVMKVSGHRNMSGLQRYTHYKTTGDKYEGWPWLDVVTRPHWAGEGKG